MKVYYDNEANLDLLKSKNVVVLGYGSQGHAHALNLKESGLKVCVGLRQDSANWSKAKEAGLEVKSVSEAVKWGNVIMILLPDQNQKSVYDAEIAPYLKENERLFNIKIEDLLTVNGEHIDPLNVYRKVVPFVSAKLAGDKLAGDKLAAMIDDEFVEEEVLYETNVGA